jgi:signal recognition particle subunit SRP68
LVNQNSSLAIGRSQALLDNPKKALALFAHARNTASSISSLDPNGSQEKPLGLEVTSEQAHSLQTLLQELVNEQRSLVVAHNRHEEAVEAEKSRRIGLIPFIDHLDEYPLGGVDLTNLVDYPPKVRPIPVKPIFLDVAWNYIEYPGQGKQNVQDNSQVEQEIKEERKETKRGWWGFGRS